MEGKVYSVSGSELRTIELNDYVFNAEYSEGSVYYAIRNENANKRVGTACTKTRSEVKGTTSKPWKQKGTGRARSGRRRSPVWVGGGIVFGPKPRDYSYSMPKKEKRLAVRSILSQINREERMTIVEDFSVESGKTKDLVALLKNFSPEAKTMIILKDDDAMLKRSARNIPWVTYMAYNRLNAHDLFYTEKLIVLETAVKNLNDFYAAKE